MRKILVTKGSVNYNAGSSTTFSDIDSLTEGALAAYETGGSNDGTVLDGTTPTFASDTEAITFVVDRGTDGPEMSVPVYRDGLRYSKETYTAPVAKVMYIGDDGSAGSYDLNLPTLAADDVARIRYIDKTKPEWDRSRETEVEYIVQSGDADSDVQSGLVTAFNAAGIDVTAAAVGSGSNLGISFTADTAGEDFQVVPEGILEDADTLEYKYVNGVYDGTYETAVANNPGQGTYAQVLELEKKFRTQDGGSQTNYLRNDLYAIPNKAVSGETYVIYTLTWKAPNNRTMMGENQFAQNLTICVPSSETGVSGAITALDNILSVA